MPATQLRQVTDSPQVIELSPHTLAIVCAGQRFEGVWSDVEVCSTRGWKMDFFELPKGFFFHRAKWHGIGSEHLVSIHTEMGEIKESCRGAIRFESYRVTPFVMDFWGAGTRRRWRFKSFDALLAKAPKLIAVAMLTA